MDNYTLYLDESTTSNAGRRPTFVIAGIVIKNEYHDSTFTDALNHVKSVIWPDIPTSSNIILHEKEVKDATQHRQKKSLIKSEYRRFFYNANNATILYTELSHLLRTSDIYTMGCAIDKDLLYNNYTTDICNDEYNICLQVLMENFCHFLRQNNVVGSIKYEAREPSQNADLMQRFYQIKAIGTLYIDSYAIQKYIKDIEFPSKQDNIAGLQMADFLPNQIGKKVVGATLFANTQNFNNNIFRKAYNGNVNNKKRYGIKSILQD